MRFLTKGDEIRDITRTYFDHPAWRMQWGDPVPDMPLDVQLEFINRCNLACTACPINHQVRKKSSLTWDLLKRIADEAADEGVCYFTVCGIGEASLHPDLFRFLRYVRDKNVQPRGMRKLSFMPTVLISNAMWSSKQVQECLENPPDLLSLSLAGLTDEEIIDRRRPINLEKFFSTVKNIYENRKVVRGADGGVSPIIHISTHIYPFEMEERVQEIEEFKKKWLGVSDVIVLKPTMVDQHHRDFDRFTSAEVPDTLRYTNISAQHFQRTAPCMEVSRRLSLDSDGNVWCGHHNSEDFGTHLGNAYHQTLREIWHGEKMNDFRKQVRAGIFNRPGCKSCGGEIRDWHRDPPRTMEKELMFGGWGNE
jgi:MoaA/NifB/PqqE/SkfB family radical SAM enzyme